MGAPPCSLALYGQQDVSVQLLWASLAATLLFTKGKVGIIGWHWARPHCAACRLLLGQVGAPLCNMVVHGAQ